MARIVLKSFLTFLVLAPSLASASWRFDETTACVITGETPETVVVVIHDYQAGRYTIAVSQTGRTWVPGPDLSIAFQGGRELVIGTDQHFLSDEGDVLMVSDRGFGNVLDGMQFNQRMTIKTGDHSVEVNLNGAAPAVAEFRDCPSFKSS